MTRDQNLPPWADPQRFRFNNFDLLRFVLASLVILSHAWPLTGRGYAGEPGVVYLHASLGELAVDGFFLISGFLIAGSWQSSRGVGPFLLKRARRIYPGFLVAFAFSLLVVAPLAGAPWGNIFRPGRLWYEATRAVRLDFPDAPGAFAGLTSSAVNGSMWTIKYEAGCYVLVALLGTVGLLARRHRAAWAMAGLFAATLLAAAAVKLAKWQPQRRRSWEILGWPQHYAYFLSFFLAGVLFYLFRRRIPCSGPLAALAAIVTWLAPMHPFSRAAVLPISLTYLLFWLAYTPRLRFHGFGRWGDFSYGIYLYGFPIQQLLIAHLPAARSPWANAASAWPLAILAGAASWHLVEKPVLARRRLAKRADRVDAPAADPGAP